MRPLAFASRLPNPLVAALVVGYRRWVSPRKGWSCPHRLLHGGRSCSAQALWLLERRSAWEARGLMRRRFERCRAAAQSLDADRDSDESAEPRRKRRRRRESSPPEQRRSSWCDAWDVCDLYRCLPRGRAIGCVPGDSGGDCTPDCCS